MTTSNSLLQGLPGNEIIVSVSTGQLLIVGFVGSGSGSGAGSAGSAASSPLPSQSRMVFIGSGVSLALVMREQYVYLISFSILMSSVSEVR